MSDEVVSQLKGKIWYCVDRMLVTDPSFTKYKFSTKYVNALVELIFLQLVDSGQDLEAFAKHAGRDVISVDDMRLLLRKSPELTDMICT